MSILLSGRVGLSTNVPGNQKEHLTPELLRVRPGRGVQVIRPISMKLGQFEGVHPKLLHSKFKEIWSKPGGVDHPLVFVCFFFNDQKTPKNWSKV